MKSSPERHTEEIFAFQRILESAMNTMHHDHRQEFAQALELWADVNIRRTNDPDIPLPPACRILDVLMESFFMRKSSKPVYFGPEVFEAVRGGAPLKEECENCECRYPKGALVTCALCQGAVRSIVTQ